MVKENIGGKIIIRAESLKYVYMCIDEDYAVHSDIRIHTGGVISMGNGVLQEKALVKRLNKKISAEADIVVVSEYIPYNL